jgi:hypothetical protein
MTAHIFVLSAGANSTGECSRHYTAFRRTRTAGTASEHFIHLYMLICALLVSDDINEMSGTGVVTVLLSARTSSAVLPHDTVTQSYC